MNAANGSTPFIHPPKRQPTPLSFTPSQLNFDAPPTDPIAAARAWIEESLQLPTPNPNALYVASVDADGRPSLRAVLLRAFDADGAVFFTNHKSRKGRELAGQGCAALLMHWDHLDRQLRLEGSVESTSDALSDQYFRERSRSKQIGAWASEQSQPLADRATFDARCKSFEERFAGGDVPRPPHWAGFRIRPSTIEFWQGHPDRLHDRIVYTRSGDHWTVSRLYP
ncbi:MAG: pyridoxamine 5'-phosphate oxidase [Planctomycetes bacterium]|nr:pyridoxamine 5'-phosphate oxidase [Planctomycetota bacterium]